MYASFENLRIGDGAGINFCKLEVGDKDQIIDTAYIIDRDGSLSPGVKSSTTTSTLLSNGASMMTFVDPEQCTTLEKGCYSYCENTCFRSVRYEVKPDTMEDYTLKVCDRNDSSKCSLFSDGTRGGPNDVRTFIAHLPVGGLYDAVFLDRAGREVAPAEGEFAFDEDFCPPSSRFGVAIANGPTLLHEQVTISGQEATEKPTPTSEPISSEEDDNEEEEEDEDDPFWTSDWFIHIINDLLP